MSPHPILRPCITALFILVLAASFPFFALSGIASASDASSGNVYYENLAAWNTPPNGAVLLIVDGLGSYYLFPELAGKSLDNEPAGHAYLRTLSYIWDNGFRISKMKAPVPVTENGHSVLVTGNRKANSEIVGYANSTFLDVLREEGFICIGVMQRGDFESMRNKFDVIIYDKTNSVNNVDFTIQKNEFPASDPEIIRRLVSVFEAQQRNASSYTNTKDTGEKYAGYNRFGLDAAVEALTVMENYPDQKFILVINVGGTDSTGHYRGYYAYLDSVDRLDADLEKLFEKCRRNDLLFVLTADHGMAFEALDKKSGGHSSAKYSKANESLYIPFIVFGNTIRSGVVYGPDCGQEDVAPTLLSIFEIRSAPRFSQGNILPAKKYASLYLQFPAAESFELYRQEGDGSVIVFSSAGFFENYTAYSLSGLPPGSYLLKWQNAGGNEYIQDELRLQIEKDTTVDLSDYLKKPALTSLTDFNKDAPPLSSHSSLSSLSSFSSISSLFSGGISSFKLTKTAGFLLIGLINIAGGAAVYNFYKKRH
ncbi:MAG: alkaline phosphatase family protein [Methanimicrococcus sp.]|nr:alkaline phosphatase family protein [Methanimicrococcus sp.]